MFKKILKAIGSAIAVLVVVIVAASAYSSYKSAGYEKTAVPYVKEVITAFSKWDLEIAKPYFHESITDNTSSEDMLKMFRWFSKLGSLETIEQPQFRNLRSGINTSIGSNSLITYSAKAHYENGEANLTINIIDLDDGFSVYSFNLKSMDLAD